MKGGLFMADIQLKNLNEITNTSQLTSTKNLLIFDNSTNAGNRISLTTLANSISDQTITGLAGKNQSLKAAIDALNSNIVNTPITNTVRYSGDNTVFDTLHANATDGTYYKTGAAFSSVHPVLGGSSGIVFGYRMSTLYGWQRFKSSSKETTRELVNGTWSEWVDQPTRAEMDDLKNSLSPSSAYTTAAINNIKNDWNGLSTGFITGRIESGGGPYYYYMGFKYSNNHGCIIIMTYAVATESRPMYVAITDGVWSSPYAFR